MKQVLETSWQTEAGRTLMSVCGDGFYVEVARVTRDELRELGEAIDEALRTTVDESKWVTDGTL